VIETKTVYSRLLEKIQTHYSSGFDKHKERRWRHFSRDRKKDGRQVSNILTILQLVQFSIFFTEKSFVSLEMQ
jgi:hypothetical protein